MTTPGTNGIADYYSARWSFLDLPAAMVPSFNRCVACAEHYTVPSLDLREVYWVMRATLKAPYYVSGFQLPGRPFTLAVAKEEPRRPDDLQECRRVFKSDQLPVWTLQQICQWWQDQLI